VSKAEFRLGWREDWGNTASDLDLILLNPSGGAILTGASLNNPEVVSTSNDS